MPLQRKRRKKRKKNPNRAKCAAHFKEWATNGRKMIINGKEMTVYTSGKLVEAFANVGIPRTYMCFHLWIKNGFMPESPIKTKNRSWYTRGMIECLAMTALECGMTKVTPNMEYVKTRWFEEFDKVVRKELM